MKKYILIVFLITFSNLKAQKIIELHYEGVVSVDAFNDFGKDEPFTDAYGEFIFSPMEKKLVRYDRDKQTAGKDAYIMNEYIIDNSAFLINGLTTNWFNYNTTALLDSGGKLAGKVEYNAETKILALTEWPKGKVITIKYLIISAMEKDKAPVAAKSKIKIVSDQTPAVATTSAFEPLLFNEKGIAEVILSKPELNETEMKDRLQEFIKQYYMQARVLEVNPNNNSTTLEGSNWDVFNRRFFPSRRPLINAKYSMTLVPLESGVKISIQHIGFDVDQMKYYLELSDLLNGKLSSTIYKEDKPAFLANSAKVIKSLNYYLDNEEIKYFEVSSE